MRMLSMVWFPGRLTAHQLLAPLVCVTEASSQSPLVLVMARLFPTLQRTDSPVLSWLHLFLSGDHFTSILRPSLIKVAHALKSFLAESMLS